MTSPPQGPYKVVQAGTLAQRLGKITARAVQHGIKAEFLATIGEIALQLAQDPVSWGDEVWTYQAAGLEEYHRLYKMLSIHYAVDTTNRVVYLKECKPVLAHPLAEP